MQCSVSGFACLREIDAAGVGRAFEVFWPKASESAARLFARERFEAQNRRGKFQDACDPPRCGRDAHARGRCAMPRLKFAGVTAKCRLEAAARSLLLPHDGRSRVSGVVATLRVDKNLIRQARALASPQPIRAMWEYSSDTNDTSLGIEFMALARHRKAIRTEFGRTGERFRSMQSGALSQLLEDYGLKDTLESPETLAVLITSVSRILVMESGLGIVGGHSQVFELVERWLTRLRDCAGETSRITTNLAPADIRALRDRLDKHAEMRSLYQRARRAWARWDDRRTVGRVRRGVYDEWEKILLANNPDFYRIL